MKCFRVYGCKIFICFKDWEVIPTFFWACWLQDKYLNYWLWFLSILVAKLFPGLMVTRPMLMRCFRFCVCKIFICFRDSEVIPIFFWACWLLASEWIFDFLVLVFIHFSSQVISGFDGYRTKALFLRLVKFLSLFLRLENIPKAIFPTFLFRLIFLFLCRLA